LFLGVVCCRYVSGFALDFVGLLWSLVVLASLDSVNPCAISMTASIALVASTTGVGGFRALVSPLSFVFGVYLGYVAVGFVASWILSFSSLILAFVVILAVVLAVMDIREALSERALACRVGECQPSWLRLLPYRYAPLLLAASGCAVSWSFMLCSAAPYLVFLGLLARAGVELPLRAALIAIYCLIVVTPLILAAITPVALLERFQVSYRAILVARSLLLLVVAAIGTYYLYTILH